jgi:hypothetical protein
VTTFSTIIKAAAWRPPRPAAGGSLALAVLAGHQAEHEPRVLDEPLGEQLRRRDGRSGSG